MKSAKGLPRALSHFVFCQYSFWSHPDPVIVPPSIGKDRFLEPEIGSGSSFVFDDRKEFSVLPSEEFVDHCADGALSIEVWGHRSQGFGSDVSSLEYAEHVIDQSRSIMDRCVLVFVVGRCLTGLETLVFDCFVGLLCVTSPLTNASGVTLIVTQCIDVTHTPAL